MTVVEFERINKEVILGLYQQRLLDPSVSSLKWEATYREWQAIADQVL